MKVMPASLQGRLLIVLIGMVVAVWTLTVSLTWFDARHELDELLDSHLAQGAALLIAQQTREAGEEEHDLDAPILHRYAPKVAFQVFHEGRLTMRSVNAPTSPMVTLEAHGPDSFASQSINGQMWRIFVTRGGEHDVTVIVGEQMASRTSILRAVLRSTLWPMALAMPLLFGAVWWAVSRGLSPLRGLARTLKQRHPRSLQALAVDGAPAEMQPAISALNELFDRISALMAAESRFTADAAHELRTPIAATRMQAQVALGETDEAARRHALEATIAGCDRANRLVEQLLTLSRLDANAGPPATRLNLGDLTRSVVAELAPLALRKQQSVEVAAEGDCVVNGEPTLLAVLIRNIVDNAIRYSPSHAILKISVMPQDGQIALRLEDSGPGMSDEHLKRIGDRFFRVLGSGQEGSGLGLSIVQRIAAVHGAKVGCSRSSNLGGLAVEIVLSRAQC